MAETLSDVANGGFDADALRNSIKAINAKKEKAAELVSAAGAETKNAIENHNFDKTALTFVARLARKEPEQQQATVAAVVTYAKAMGFFDQLSMFSDAAAAMQAVIEEATAGELPLSNAARLTAPAPTH